MSRHGRGCLPVRSLRSKRRRVLAIQVVAPQHSDEEDSLSPILAALQQQGIYGDLQAIAEFAFSVSEVRDRRGRRMIWGCDPGVGQGRLQRCPNPARTSSDLAAL